MDEAAEMFVFARTGSTDTRTFVMVNVDWKAMIRAVNQKAWCFFNPKRRHLFVAPWIGVRCRSGIELGGTSHKPLIYAASRISDQDLALPRVSYKEFLV